jgi:hypothetical protein
MKLKLYHPVGYSIPDHAAKIAKSPEHKQAAERLGLTVGQFHIEVAAELKRLVAEQQAAELAEYEQILGARALTAAIEKAEKAKEAA